MDDQPIEIAQVLLWASTEALLKFVVCLVVLVRIVRCLATSQTPENTRSSLAAEVGYSVSSSNWSVTSRPSPRQFMPSG